MSKLAFAHRFAHQIRHHTYLDVPGALAVSTYSGSSGLDGMACVSFKTAATRALLIRLHGYCSTLNSIKFASSLPGLRPFRKSRVGPGGLLARVRCTVRSSERAKLDRPAMGLLPSVPLWDNPLISCTSGPKGARVLRRLTCMSRVFSAILVDFPMAKRTEDPRRAVQRQVEGLHRRKQLKAAETLDRSTWGQGGPIEFVYIGGLRTKQMPVAKEAEKRREDALANFPAIQANARKLRAEA